MKHTYPDGTTIELGWGDSRPPGVKTGQHTNVNHPWARMDGGPWRPANGARSMHGVREWVLAAVTAAEAFEVICPDDPGIDGGEL